MYIRFESEKDRRVQVTLMVALVLHVLAGVFWAGTTFALARTGGNQAIDSSCRKWALPRWRS
jgi:hypothetical protein